MRRVIVLAVGVGISAAVLAGCSSDSSMEGHSMPDDTASASAAADGAAGDIMFAQMMIPHHQQAVEMADIALAKPDSSALVQELAQEIRSAQQPEIDQMTAWLTKWNAPAGDMEAHAGHMSGMMTDEQMADLEAASGAEFDTMWLEMMIEHHEGAIVMAEDVAGTTQDPEVKALADAVITAQRGEIDLMRAELDS